MAAERAVPRRIWVDMEPQPAPSRRIWSGRKYDPVASEYGWRKVEGDPGVRSECWQAHGVWKRSQQGSRSLSHGCRPCGTRSDSGVRVLAAAGSRTEHRSRRFRHQGRVLRVRVFQMYEHGVPGPVRLSRGYAEIDRAMLPQEVIQELPLAADHPQAGVS